ncbi:MAG: PAS domain S-box protein [Chloroflexi bacterium]|nr:PAS domain S-box protein [Chloroflexota bacterium]
MIRDREKTKEQLVSELTELRQQVAVLPVGIFRTDAQGNYVYVNERWCELSGLTPEQACGEGWARDLSPESRENILKEWYQVVRKNLPLELEYCFQRPDGVTIWVFCQAMANKDDLGKLGGYVGTITDITVRKRIEEVLARSEARFYSLVEQAGAGIATTDVEGSLTFVNRAFIQMVGYPTSEVLGQPFIQFIHHDDVERIQRHFLEGFGRYPEKRLEYRLLHKGGRVTYCYSDPVAILFQSQTVGSSIIIHDITESKRAAEELEQLADQLALLNDIGAKIAAVMELDSVLDRAAHLVQESFDFHHVALFTLDREQGELLMKTKAGSFISHFPPDHRLKLGQGMVGWVGLHGERILANDVNVEPRYVNLYPGIVLTRSELSVPIRVGEEIVGVLDVQSPQTNAFDEKDVRVIETVADQIAIAIENARLYEAIRRELAERQRAEDALREYAFIVNTSREFMTLIDRDHIYQAVNRSYYQAHSKTREEIVGKTVVQVWDLETYETRIKGFLNECFAGNETRSEVWFEFPALGLRCLDVTYYPYYGDGQTVTHTVVVSRDITERKHGAEALQKAHERNEQLLMAISSILIGVSSDDRVTHWNAPAEIAFGIAATDVIGQPFFECGVPWDWTEIAMRVAECRNGNLPTHLNDIRYIQPSGKDGFLDVTFNPFTGEDLTRPGFLLLGEEITERKILETQLIQAQKLEAIGQLAAGVAHEINTPIQYVGDNTHFIRDAFADVSDLLEKYQCLLQAAQDGTVSDEMVTEVQSAIDKADVAYLSKEITLAIQESLEGILRVTEIVRAMRGFSHPGVEEKTASDINDIISGAITMTRNEWKHVAEIRTDFGVSLPLVPCLPGAFSQVIVNVLVNAAHAIADVVEEKSGDKGTIIARTNHDGDWVEIYISDTGTGIPKEIQSRVFDPFFTTKEVGKGTGQGLAIAHNVVVGRLGGTMTFETRMGQGTTFIIRLPIESQLG